MLQFPDSLNLSFHNLSIHQFSRKDLSLAQFIPRIYNKIIIKILGYFWGVTQSACGKGGGTLCFTSSPATGCSSSGGSTIVGAFLVGARTAGLSSVQLLKVTTALTSSIIVLGSLAEPISGIPLGFCCV